MHCICSLKELTRVYSDVGIDISIDPEPGSIPLRWPAPPHLKSNLSSQHRRWHKKWKWSTGSQLSIDLASLHLIFPLSQGSRRGDNPANFQRKKGKEKTGTPSPTPNQSKLTYHHDKYLECHAHCRWQNLQSGVYALEWIGWIWGEE